MGSPRTSAGEHLPCTLSSAECARVAELMDAAVTYTETALPSLYSDAFQILTQQQLCLQPPSAVKRERQRREQELAQRDTGAIRGMKMGARDRSYLVRDGEIDVMRNVYGGVEVRLHRCGACCLCCLGNACACGSPCSCDHEDAAKPSMRTLLDGCIMPFLRPSVILLPALPASTLVAAGQPAAHLP